MAYESATNTRAPCYFCSERDWRSLQGCPTKEFYGVWEEAEAALGAVKAGAIKHIFKVAGKHEVIAVCDFPDGDIMDQAVQGLPIFQLGYSHLVTDVEWLPLRPYEHWAQDLKKLAQR
jgi:muconolactone delta-isomerase